MNEKIRNQIIRNICKLKFLYLAAFCSIILFNTAALAKKIIEAKHIVQKPSILKFPGLQFLGLREILKGVEYAGYYTDKDFDNPKNKGAAALFSQGQYILAPTILELNNTNREFIILDCSSERKAQAIMRKIHALPLKKSFFGVILARKAR